ncbi:MAG: SiaB family protein kinase [Bacteroidales bacterium]|nr:SiaB family protein kinase [Bacteroidales bacterium]
MAFDIEGWYNEIGNGDIIAHHKGAISAELISRVLEHVENELNNREEKSKLRKKVYNVMVESLQNLFHHTENPPENVKLGDIDKKFVIFVLKKETGGEYSFTSGNFVIEKRVKFLKDRLDQINYLTADELKILYQLILNNDEYSDKGGGGLGLVDIAKRTENRYEYSFHNQNNGHYFFCLKILINN